ncbi:hypothetical protein KJ605_02515 [Patescibacteria group bacterium]|nr:hypothetical protein [Patescibacteria group bacterium]MBU1970623.1 hypothetical protein [Patescibacteria group bacterium]
MNLVPVVLIFVLILGAGYLLLKDTLKLPWFRNDNTLEITRMEEFPKGWLTERDIDKTRRVIENKAELQEFFEYVDMGSEQATLEAVLGRVDFDQEVILAVSSDTQEETEGLIRIKRVEIDKAKNSLYINIIQYKPDDTCVPEIKKNVLVDIVKIERSDYEISFDVVKQNRSCD